MLPGMSVVRNWHAQIVEGIRQPIAQFLSPALTPSPVPLQRPNISQLAQPDAVLPRFVSKCAVARKYLDLLGPLDWEHFPERDPKRAWPGPKPTPRAPFVAAYLVKLEEQKRYMSDLREYLAEHPALVWILGFPLRPSPDYEHGFAADASLPSARHFGRVLRTLDNRALQFLLDSAVAIIGRELPPEVLFGDAVSGDTKHIIAWVTENNPKAYIKDRYDKTRQPTGDPDCRLGCKRKHKHGEPGATITGGDAADSPASSLPTPIAVGTAPAEAKTPPPTPTTNPVPANSVEVGEFYWGYGSGTITTKVAGWGEFLLAELTQPFDQGDATYFSPLLADVERRLGRRPRYGAYDAAFDAHYVYQYHYEAGGFAAAPLVPRGGIIGRSFDDSGLLPLCDAGLPMPLKSTFICHATEVEHERGRYVCPLLFPQPTGQACPVNHKNWKKKGCTLTMGTCPGARIRYQLDRQSDEYKAIYKQRTASERINSQAVELGIERPKLRNGKAIANQNTLIYVLINLRAIHRIRAQKKELAQQREITPPGG
jgi:hypothetical protein